MLTSALVMWSHLAGHWKNLLNHMLCSAVCSGDYGSSTGHSCVPDKDSESSTS